MKHKLCMDYDMDKGELFMYCSCGWNKFYDDSNPPVSEIKEDEAAHLLEHERET